jgi:uncharacterized membrane protein
VVLGRDCEKTADPATGNETSPRRRKASELASKIWMRRVCNWVIWKEVTIRMRMKMARTMA